MSHFDLKCSLNIHDSFSELLLQSADYMLCECIRALLVNGNSLQTLQQSGSENANIDLYLACRYYQAVKNRLGSGRLARPPLCGSFCHKR